MYPAKINRIRNMSIMSGQILTYAVTDVTNSSFLLKETKIHLKYFMQMFEKLLQSE